jgi:hypothetical protein
VELKIYDIEIIPAVASPRDRDSMNEMMGEDMRMSLGNCVDSPSRKLIQKISYISHAVSVRIV